MRIEFDSGFVTGWADGALFDAPMQVIRAQTPDELHAAFAAMTHARAAGHWLAGSFSYELGYCFEDTLRPLLPAYRRVPLIELGVYAAPTAPAPLPIPAPEDISCTLTPRWAETAYAPAFDQVQRYISAGDIYQTNLTFPIAFDTPMSARALYAALRAKQPVGYGALIERADGTAVLSRSPELFFETDPDGTICVRPMKGTVKRGATPQADALAKKWLAASEKNQAENLMIVDLLRNDLARISRIGSVKVPKLFEIESYATVHQMTSTVTAQLEDGVTTEAMLRALFPCGSITGAPKIRAMEIIHELEPWERGLYCGAIGWMAPFDAAGRQTGFGAARFNVAIRTLEMDARGQGTLAVGGGLVHDSTGHDEYDEALLKAAFAQLGTDQ